MNETTALNSLVREVIGDTIQAPLEGKIGCFNIRNSFEHLAAAELFLLGHFSYLSFQEPFGAHKNKDKQGNESWISFMRKELGMARILGFFTHHQVIFPDETRWGGKIDETFHSIQEGKGISVVLNTEGDLYWGIISIYAPCYENTSGRNGVVTQDRDSIRDDILLFILETLTRWHKKYDFICHIIVGDFQETESITDKDNIGKFRKEASDKGIFNSLVTSHYSLVRSRTKEIPYMSLGQVLQEHVASTI